MGNPNERQVGGGHYRSKFQHWDFVLGVLGGRYLEGCLTKYASRWRKKNGLQDLDKAEHYLDKLLSTVEANQNTYRGTPDEGIRPAARMARAFSEANDLNEHETAIMVRVATWRTLADLEAIRVHIAQLRLLAP
jgi:hypothetical protein